MSEQQLIDDAMPATEENGALLDEIIDSTQAIRSESDRGRVKSQLSSFLMKCWLAPCCYPAI